MPAELRNRIWAMVLNMNDEKAIPIVSPKKRGVKPRLKLRSENLGSLLLVNKQVYQEATSIFYKTNEFIVGNANYGSIEFPNFHALTAFMKRAQKVDIASITKLSLRIELGSTLWSSKPDYNWNPALKQADVTLVREFMAVSRAIAKHFTGVKSIT